QPTLWRGPSGRGVRGDSIDVVPGPDATRTAPPPAHEAGPQNGLLRRRPPSEIRNVLAEAPFNGEGHRKAWARLRGKGIRTSKRRVLFSGLLCFFPRSLLL